MSLFFGASSPHCPSSCFVVFFIIWTLVWLDSSAVSNASVVCQTDGTCEESESSDDADTRCSECQSCTFENCCHRIYTSPLINCEIPGWRAQSFTGELSLARDSQKRSLTCSETLPCPEGEKCIAYEEGDTVGFCWRDEKSREQRQLTTLLALVGMVILGAGR